MKKQRIYIAAGFMFSIISSLSHAQILEGKAKIFEPGVISLEETWDEYISFSPMGLNCHSPGRGKIYRIMTGGFTYPNN